ncbi:sugar ABC transporter substrate-binding protein [Fibrobacterales bacterium]|nr:sugar ABC transporter substrate-binding protein [Fibrobacterales bacterium]
MCRFLSSAITLFFLLLACNLTGCNETSSGKVVQLWVFNNSPNPAEDMKKLLKGFSVENPGITVEVTILDWGSGFSKIVLAVATGNGPDVIQVPSTWAASLTDLDALYPLDSAFNSWEGKPELFVEGAREVMKTKISTNITSLPWFLDVRPFYYHSDIISGLKIQPNKIKNRDEFISVLKNIKDKKFVVNGRQISPMEYPAKNDWNIVHNFSSWIFSAGGSYITEDLTESNLLSEQTMDGIKFYLDLVKNGYNDYSNLDKTTAGVSDDFDKGKTAFIGETTSKSMYLENQKIPYGVMIPPTAKKGGEGVYFLGGSNLGIFSESQVKREALALLRYLTMQSDVQLQFSRISGFLPAFIETYDLPYFSANENYKVFKKIVEKGKSYPSVPYWGTIETDILTKRFNNIFNIISNSHGGTWPERQIDAELHAADREINDVIRRARL